MAFFTYTIVNPARDQGRFPLYMHASIYACMHIIYASHLCLDGSLPRCGRARERGQTSLLALFLQLPVQRGGILRRRRRHRWRRRPSGAAGVDADAEFPSSLERQ